MNIAGLTKTTLLDYPNHVASTIFTHGCNMRCPFCHNGHLVSVSNTTPIDETKIFEFLIKRRDVIDGICISGGEPTLQPKLIPFMEKVKSLGIKIKLDTNGLKPDVLIHLIETQLIDYIAMDIKNSKERYLETTGLKVLDLDSINTSINLIKTFTIPYEFRTTIMQELHTIEDLIAIAKWIGPVDLYILQNYKKSEQQLSNTIFTGFEKNTLAAYKQILSKYYANLRVQ